MIVIDDGDDQVLHVAAERVAQNDELDEREQQRKDDEERAAPEPPQFALDDGPGAMHGLLLSPLHDEAEVARRALLQRVAQVMPRVMHEHVVQRRALHRQRLHA